jgi:dipeptidyl aminopeptidase/acylaminoacyl peptidase
LVFKRVRIKLQIYIGLVCAFSVLPIKAQQRPVTIEDCIGMVRIQQTYDVNDPTVVFSPDGRHFVTMIWRGNLKTNLNDYTLLLYDAEHLDLPPKELVRMSFGYERRDQHARPLKQFAFVTGNRLAALATFDGKPRQVVTIDLRTKAVRPLTRHPAAVLSFATTPDGKSIVYAAQEPRDGAREAALYRDGFSLEDRNAIDPVSFPRIAAEEWFNPTTEYFLVTRPGTQPRKIYEGKHGAPNFWISPEGRHAVVYPYVSTVGKQTVGLIDVTSGKIEPLITGDNLSSSQIWAQWSRNSQSVHVFAMPFEKPAVLSEVNLATRQVTSIALGQYREWDPLGWSVSKGELILTRSGYPRSGDPEQTLATVRRTATGWEGPNAIAQADSKVDLNSRYYSGTNGRLIVGVKDNLSEPPELAAYDFHSKRTTVLTNLNPQLRDLKLGEVTRIRWSGPYDKETSFGYLIKPVGYELGRKYPLIIQLKDEGYYPEDNSFILDGTQQYAGAAIQVWANAGFMVLFTPWSRAARAAVGTPKEDEYMKVHIESALDMLESQRIIDRSKVAITGWSRAGWMSQYIVANAATRFAAASNIDNVEYNLTQYILGRSPQNYITQWGGVQPWGPTSERWREQAIDFKYDKAQTPRLIEVHGHSTVPYYAESYAALKTAKIPVEFYLYPDASHNLKSPIHRFNSLSTHTDWFRFWLQGYEDPSPKKKDQYTRWRKMRDEWEAAKREQQKTNKPQ